VTDERIKETRNAARARVSVRCNERHDHSALGGCLVGDPRDLVVLKLCEVIARERRIVRDALRDLERDW